MGRLVELGWVEPAAAETLRGARPQVVPPVTATRFPAAPFFLQLVERKLGARLGEDRIYTGLEVTTTLDLRVQERAVEAYAEGFPGIGPSGALVALDPATGGVRALVGGKDYAADQLNLALAPRQPGSTFKPFALAAWVEEGFSPESVFPAPAERVFEVDGSPWPVRNYGGRGYAPMTLRQATWRSVNTVYADLVVRLGPRRLADVATRAGIGRSLDPDPSLVLGTAEVTPLELAEAYNTLAADGVHRRAFTVAQARRGGRLLYRAPLRQEQALPEQAARMVTDVLRGVIESGTGRAADIGRPAAGKTGTTDNYGDAWFAGYTPVLTAVVWMGNRDTNASMPGEPTGGGLPARVWGAFMRAALAEVPATDFPEPEGDLEVVRTDPTAPPSCPTGQARPSDHPGAPCVAVTPTESPGAEVESPATTATTAPSPSATDLPAPVPTLTRPPGPIPSAGATASPTSSEERDED